MYKAAALQFHLVLMGALGFQSVWSSRKALALALLPAYIEEPELLLADEEELQPASDLIVAS